MLLKQKRDMQNQFSRTEMLLGKPAMETLRNSRVAVFGVGGVGGYAVEVLARSGVGAIDIFDNDIFTITNVNRQLHALLSNIGQKKVNVVAEHIKDINPDCVVRPNQMFYTSENADEVDLSQYDYVADCIDTVSAKMELIKRCHDLHIPLISSMGAANKLDVTRLQVADISKTNMDPIAKIIRKKMRKLNISHLKVVFSNEEPLTPIVENDAEGPDSNDGTGLGKTHRVIPASNAFVPAAAGLIIGSEIIKDLIRVNESALRA